MREVGLLEALEMSSGAESLLSDSAEIYDFATCFGHYRRLKDFARTNESKTVFGLLVEWGAICDAMFNNWVPRGEPH